MNNPEFEAVMLAHGGGGELMQQLIHTVLLPALGNSPGTLSDSAVLDAPGQRLAFTTDSYVVKPLFFHGGDIGRLAVCGTVNDLAVCGGSPIALSLGMIIAEGTPGEVVQRIAESVGVAAREAGVPVVTGDTKVVERGAADGVFLNTSGIGLVPESVLLSPTSCESGDAVIVSGAIGDHGIAIMSEREGLSFESPVVSDVAPLNHMIADVLAVPEGIRCMRDATRGGVAAVLNELAVASGVCIRIEESAVPVHPAVHGACDLLGLDPFEVANEGKVVVVCSGERAERAVQVMRRHTAGAEAAIVGQVEDGRAGRVLLQTPIGGDRILDMPYGEQLPRIC
ncbi:MAG: hydrogenase expression/formation protein HypE [Lentisphaerae bacterium]|nr:hydrogenase expression/formation protein HypE [Lentisphaerota bacterium]MBT4818397.1 hydrogenase expression/formation protein HypE [Lentisphaerota bacterium]MBT5609475.1 hydrogenase expression/formation protein HypE [Lentisphaerota bacterium]MBT7057714.1 hydrogenase expression/formation protein HypE [Lentisphaerota bacterium]MBT7848663.1 hydrogenase expression/formation protein HypE [Lentisphaerota bacterium]